MDDWGNLIRVVAAVAGAYWAILWLSAIVWTYRDAKDRNSDSTSQVVAVFLVLVFNIPGLFLSLRCGGAWPDPCHACGKPLNLSWQACPYCGKRRLARAALNPSPEPAS